MIVGTLIGGILTFLYGRFKEKSRLEISLEELKISMELINNNIKKEVDDLKWAQAAELRNAIRSSCKYHLKHGWISLDEKQDILACHDAYMRIVDSMGIPNGVTEDILNEMRKLPNIKPDIEE